MTAAATVTPADAAETTGPNLNEVIDQQNVTPDTDGRVLLDFRNGEEDPRCLTSRADHVSVGKARNITDPVTGSGWSRSPTTRHATRS